MNRLHLRRSSPPDGIRPEPLDPVYLEAAARALAPEPERLERVRSAVMTEFRAAAGRSVALERTGGRRRGPRVVGPRRALAFSIGIVLAMGSLGVVAAGSSPGRPLYGLRVAFESLALPAPGTSARVTAQLERLERRLSEAGQATLDGDPGAASDAIGAYRAELEDAGTDVDPAGADVSRLSQALAEHAVLLARLGSELSGAAKTATTDALDQVNRVQQALGSQPSHQGPGGGNGGGTNPGDGSGGGTNPGNGNGGNGGGTNPGNGNGGNGGGTNPGNGNGGGGGNGGGANPGGNGNGGGGGPGGTPAH